MTVEYKCLNLAIVGHTNTGKTSLIRTLLRDSSFGEIEDAAGTTRHVEVANITIQNQSVIELRDTPGLEDSVALHTLLSTFQSEYPKGADCLKKLLECAEKYLEFEQEVKVIRQALECDVLLYVIDCREDFLEKYRMEISILAMASKPILPVLNFVSSASNQIEDWRGALAELQLHACVEFDTVAFDFCAEQRLYQKLQVLAEPSYTMLQALMDFRANEWRLICDACIKQVSELMLDVSMYTLFVGTAKPESDKNAVQNFVRDREQACLQCILSMLKFLDQKLAIPELPVLNGQWELDLFSPEALKSFGMDTASAAATGAAIGVGVDLLLAGLSLGAASATGAAIGATWSTSRRYGRDILAKFNGETKVCVDGATIDLLMLRQLTLLQLLFHRGHADQNIIRIQAQEPKKLSETWVKQKRQWRMLDQKNEVKGEPIYLQLEQNLSCWIKQELEQWGYTTPH